MSAPTGKLTWYLNRLRVMSLAEVSHRVRRRLHAGLQQLGWDAASKAPPPTMVASRNWVHRIIPAETQNYVDAAERILGGSIPILSLGDVVVGSPPRWNRNPAGGPEVPLVFGKSVDYRDQRLVGDIKYLWVLNRHTHLVTLAQAFSLTGDDRYLQAIGEHLSSWMAQCPYPRGPNWTSASELAMRLINWSVVWQLVGGAASPLFRDVGPDGLLREWLTTIYRHAHFIRSSFSRFSSANNHLIGEASGLFVATVTWPFWEVFDEWRRLSHDELIREIELQNGPDGVNREQSSFYQRFVVEYALITAMAGRANGIVFPQRFVDRIESMLAFLSSIMDFGGNVPMIGDADNTAVLALSCAPDHCSYRSVLALGAVVFERPALKAKAREIDDAVLWMYGESARDVFSRIGEPATPAPPRQAFPEGGYFVLGSDLDTEREVRIVADAGPLGYLSIAAHGHADALSFTLSVSGRELLIDPGTYAYQTNREWREYFRGTSAHNTVRVDGENQSVSGGSLLWTKHASVRCEGWESSDDRDRLVATHDGFTRLGDPVIHRRDLSYLKPRRTLVVRDTLECAARHSVEMFWHFSEKCSVTVEGAEVVAENDGARMVLRPPRDLGEVSLLRGSRSPKGGWVSRDFGVKIATCTAVWSARIDSTITLTTDISIETL